MVKDLISVIIPVYNAEQYVERSITSVLKNSYQQIEVIIIDDGSKDASLSICNDIAEKDPRVKVVSQKNAGTAAARNKGLEMARGEFIAFVDDDDFIHEDFYQVMSQAIKETVADVVVCDLTRDMELNQFFSMDCKNVQGILVDKLEFIEDTYKNNWTRNTTPWNKLYRATLFRDIKFPDGKGYEDAFTTYRLIYKAQSIAYVQMPMYYWYQNAESYSSKQENPRKLFYREEAIRLQSEFYKEQEYQIVVEKAKRFHLEQVFVMYWQLLNVYEQNEETKRCAKKMRKIFATYFRKNHKLCELKKDKIRYFELIHPIFGGAN